MRRPTSAGERPPGFRLPLPARFWAAVERPTEGGDGCWIWLARRYPTGYGLITADNTGRTEGAHRYSYRLHYGDIPAGLNVLHRCDNPPCVNPAHLFLGTQLDNMRDMQVKGRARHPQKTRCPEGHELTPDNLYVQRGTCYGQPITRRYCKECRRRQWREWKKRQNTKRIEIEHCQALIDAIHAGAR